MGMLGKITVEMLILWGCYAACMGGFYWLIAFPFVRALMTWITLIIGR